MTFFSYSARAASTLRECLLGGVNGPTSAVPRTRHCRPAEFGTATGHIGRDRDRALAARLRDDFGFALVLFGVQNVVLDAFALEECGKLLGFFDRYRADENGLALVVEALDFSSDVLSLPASDLKMTSASSLRIIGRLVGMTVTSSL